MPLFMHGLVFGWKFRIFASHSNLICTFELTAFRQYGLGSTILPKSEQQHTHSFTDLISGMFSFFFNYQVFVRQFAAWMLCRLFRVNYLEQIYLLSLSPSPCVCVCADGCLIPFDLRWIYFVPCVMRIPSWYCCHRCRRRRYPSCSGSCATSGVCVCVREKFCRFPIHGRRRELPCALFTLYGRTMNAPNTLLVRSSILCGFRNILFHIGTSYESRRESARWRDGRHSWNCSKTKTEFSSWRIPVALHYSEPHRHIFTP